jgi:hypothetical protein
MISNELMIMQPKYLINTSNMILMIMIDCLMGNISFYHKSYSALTNIA